MTITNLSPRTRVTGHWRDERETTAMMRRHGNSSHVALAPITRQFRSRAGAYGIIGVLSVSRGRGHVWRGGA